MKSIWYAIENKKTDDALPNVSYMYHNIKHFMFFGFSRMHDYNGYFYDIFRATRFEKMKIFLRLIPINFKRRLLRNTGILIIRKFKPYGNNYITVENIPGLYGLTEWPTFRTRY